MWRCSPSDMRDALAQLCFWRMRRAAQRTPAEAPRCPHSARAMAAPALVVGAAAAAAAGPPVAPPRDNGVVWHVVGTKPTKD